ncbi:hypothetical protein [Streptomyces ossamyceticus]|uniref:hypothetical protein n=1 Tax=Streptomyces ossamyceticus TaxID=249581 RepID=UPI0012FF27ED|nr:hypothetical protein [Streptomyces ossamyceticus]
MRESRSPEHDSASIVFIGAFNPRIFQPAWFVSQGLLSADETSDSNVQIINNDFCVFETDWVRIEVVDTRWMITSIALPLFEPLRDLALGTFSALSSTPITKIGLNSHAHYASPSREALDAFGHELVPKERIWKHILEDPRTLNLHVEGMRPDKHDGRVRVKVQPSSKVQNGIFIDVNDEFVNTDSTTPNWALEVLRDEWDAHTARVIQCRERIVSSLWGE